MASEDDCQTVMGSRCVKEITRLPVVEWVCSKISDAYVKIKNSNQTINTALHTMECVSDAVMKVATPLVRKLQSPLNFIDGFMCGTLCWMKNKAPVINSSSQKVYDLFKKNVDSLVKPFSKLGSLIMNASEFLLKQISKLPALPSRTLQSAENFVDNLFPMESRKKLKCENDSSSEVSSHSSNVALGKSLVHTAESIGRLSFKLVRAGFLISTAPFRWTYSLLGSQCVPQELVEDEVIVYSRDQFGESSAMSSDHESNLKRKNVTSTQNGN